MAAEQKQSSGRPTKLTIGFLMVNVEVSAFNAVSEAPEREGKQLHRECHTPHQLKKWCPKCEKEIQQADLVKGLPTEDGGWLTLEEAELAALVPESSKAIPVEEIVDLDDIDPLYIAKTYYLFPQSVANGQSFAVMREALRNKFAVGTWTHHKHDHLVAVRAYRDGMILHELHDHALVRSFDMNPNLKFCAGYTPKAAEVKMAKALVESLAAEGFDPSIHKERYRAAFEKLVESKKKGLAIEAPKPAAAPKPVGNFMAELEASLNAVQTKPAKANVSKQERKAS